jgi:hypothetical protein
MGAVGTGVARTTGAAVGGTGVGSRDVDVQAVRTSARIRPARTLGLATLRAVNGTTAPQGFAG